MKYWWLPLLLIGQCADCMLTHQAGIQREANPVVVWTWAELGWGAVIGAKALTVVIVVVACKFFHHPKNPMQWMRKAFHIEMAVALCVLLSVIVWNWRQLR